MVRFAEELNTKYERMTGVRRGQSFWPLPNGMNRFTAEVSVRFWSSRSLSWRCKFGSHQQIMGLQGQAI